MYLLEDEADVAEIMDHASDREDSPTPPYFEGEERGSVKFPSVCQPVYDGAMLLLIKQYSMKHKLSKEALSDLKLIQLHCPKPNTVPSTVYQFEKQFADLNKSQKLHHFGASVNRVYFRKTSAVQILFVSVNSYYLMRSLCGDIGERSTTNPVCTYVINRVTYA